MALTDDKNTLGQNPPEDKVLVDMINFGQKKLTDYLKQNPGIEYSQVEEEFIYPLIGQFANKANKSLNKITDTNIFDSKREVADRRIEALGKSLMGTTQEHTSFYGLVKQRSAANTALNNAGLYIKEYPNAVYFNPANENPDRLDRENQIVADNKKVMTVLDAAIQRERKKEIESLKATTTSMREQLDKETAEYKSAQEAKPFYERYKTGALPSPSSANFNLDSAGNPTFIESISNSKVDPQWKALHERQTALKMAEKYLEQMEQTDEISPKKFEAFLQGFSHTDWADLATLGVKNLTQSFDVVALAKKSDKGEKLSPEEMLALDFYDKFKTIASSKDAPWTYGASQGLMQSIPFMIDIALTGGVRSFVSKGAQKVSGLITNKLAKWGVKSAGKGAGAIASAAATPIGWQNMANRELESYKIDRDAEGNVNAKRYEHAPSTFGNFVLGMTEGGLSVAVEQMSRPLGKLGDKFIKKHPNSNTAKAFGALLGAGSVREGNTYIAQVIQNVRKKMNFGGFLTEMGEEYTEKIAGMLFLPDSPERQQYIKEENERRAELGMPPLSWKDEFSWKELLEIAGSVGLMSFGFSAGRVSDRLHSRAVRKDDVSAQLTEALRNAMSGKLEEAGRRLPAELRQKLDEIMDIDDQQQRADAFQALVDSAEIPPNLSEKQAIFEYIARRTEQEAAESFGEAVQQEQVEQYTDALVKAATHTSGAVIVAADAEGNQYYVKDGDPNNPDGTIIVADAQTGESKQLSPKGMQFEETSAEQYRQQLTEQLQPSPTYKQGDKVIVDGVEYTISKPSDEPGKWIARPGDGNVYEIDEKDFQPKSYQPSLNGKIIVLDDKEYTVQGKDDNGNIILTFENEQGVPERVAMPEAEFNAAMAAQQGQPGAQSSQETQASPQPTGEIQPIGKGAFGNIYDQFKGKPKEAIAFLLQTKEGEAIEALQHPEIGGIDLVWGNEKYGLEKIIDKHPEIVEDMQSRLANTSVVSVTKDKIKLESNKDLFVVAQHVFGNEKHWLITGYEKKNGTVSANTLNNETEPESKRIDTATPQNNPDISLKMLPNNKTTDTTISSKSGEGDTALSSDNVSTNKSTNNSGNNKENEIEKITAEAPKQKNGNVDFNALMDENPAAFAVLWENRSSAEDAKKQLQRVAKNIDEDIQKKQKSLEGLTDFNKIADTEAAIKQLQEKQQQVDEVIATRYPEPNTPKASQGLNDSMTSEQQPSSFSYFDGKIKNLIEIAKSSDNKLVKQKINTVSPELVSDLQKAGIDIDENYVHTIDNFSIAHALKQHGNEKSEESKGQVALSDSDFEIIPDIVENYDGIEFDKNKRGQDVIKYFKTFEDGTTYYVEEIRVGRKELSMLTMYKKKLIGEPMLENSPEALTSETVPNLLSTSKDNPNNSINNNKLNENGKETNQVSTEATETGNSNRVIQSTDSQSMHGGRTGREGMGRRNEGMGGGRTGADTRRLEAGEGRIIGTGAINDGSNDGGGNENGIRSGSNVNYETVQSDKIESLTSQQPPTFQQTVDEVAANSQQAPKPPVPPLSQQSLESRIKEIENRLSEIRMKYFGGVKGFDAIDKAQAGIDADPEYQQLKEEESNAWEELKRIEAVRNRSLLEGELPSKLPKKDEKLFIDKESFIFTEGGGIVNIRPIPQKPKKTDTKTALFSIAQDENEVYHPVMRGVLHDAENGVDVATDGHALLVIPNGNNKKTWVEGRDGKEIESEFPRWESAIPDNSIKIRVNGLQPLIDKLAGSARAAKFVDNVVVTQLDVNGQKVFFRPEYLLNVVNAMQSTGSNSLVFEFNDNLNSALIIRDASNPKKFALIMPTSHESGSRKSLITPVELEQPAAPRLQAIGEQAMAEAASLEAVNSRFNEELQQFDNHTLKGSLHLGKPLDLLQSAGVKANEITLSQPVLGKKLAEHGLTTEDLKGLSKAIQDPIMVYEWGTKAKSTVIVTELTTADGRKITIAIKAEKKGKVLSVNDVASVHGKTAERFLSEMENAKEGGLTDALRYVEKEKAFDWLGIALPNGASTQANQEQISITKVIQNFQNPKLSGENPHISDKKFTPISRPQAEALIDLLKKSGLAKDVVFGQEALQQVIEQSGNSQGLSVNIINTTFAPFKNNAEAKQWAIKNGIVGKFNSNAIGEYVITTSALDKYLHSSSVEKSDSREVHYSVLRILPEVINNSVLGETHLDYYKKDGERKPENGINPNVIIHRLYGAINIDGKNYRVKTTLKEHKDINEPTKPYTYEVTKIELLDGKLAHAENSTNPSINNSISVAKLLNGIEKSYEKGKFILDDYSPLATSQGLNALKSPAGEVYGAVKDGIVYIDDTKLNANTPIHEFGHLWNDFIKKDNPELWAKIVELTKETPYYHDLLGNPAYANLKDDDARADEAFAQAMGDEGERIFNDPNTPKSIKERFKQLFKDFWEWLGKKLGIRNLSPEQISKLTFEQAVKGAVADITSGKPITFSKVFDGVTNENTIFASAEQNLTVAQMLEGTTPIETPKHSFKNFDDARKWAKENIVGAYKNDNTGEDIYIAKNAIDKYLSKKAVEQSVNRDAHLSALIKLPQLIKTSILKETHQDRANNENIKNIQRFYGTINYEGQTHPVKITVKATKNEGNKAYSYEVMEIESPIEQILSGQSTSDGNFSDRIPPTNELSSTSDFSSMADFHPSAESRQSAAENRSSVSIGKDTNISETAKGISQNSSGARFQISRAQKRQYTAGDNPDISKKEQDILNKKGYNWFDAFARETISVKALQDKVKKLKGIVDEATDDITKNTDIDGAMNLSFGRITTKAQNFEKKEIKNLIKNAKDIIEKAGTNWTWSNDSTIKPGKEISPYDALGLYLRASDIVEAKKMGLPERGEKGFIEATGITPDGFIKQYEEKLTSKEILDLWKNIKAATSFGLKEMLDTGRIEQAEFDEYMKRDRYVPQREWEERDVNDDLHDYVKKGGKGSAYNPVIKRAKGRDSLSADPLAHIQSMGMSAIIYAEKNRYKQTAYNLVSQNIEFGKKYGLFDSQKVFYTNSGEKDADGNIIWNETTVRPEQSLFDADKETHEKIMTLKAKINRNKRKGLIDQTDHDKLRDLYNQLNIKTNISHLAEARRTTDEKQQHKVSVFVDGQEYVLIFKDAKVANAINKANNNQYSNWFFENMRRYNRFNASMNTAYNIDFGGANLARDIPFAFWTNLVDKGVVYTGRFTKNLFSPRMHSALAKYMANKSGNSKYDQYVKDYFADGSATGYAFLKEIRQIKQDVKRKIAPTGLQKTGHIAEIIFKYPFTKVFKSINEYGETMTRLATYIASRQSGKTHHEAAKDAKNVTVNFNYNSKYTKNLGIIQPFANPTVQGGYRLYELTKKHPKKMAGLFAGFIVSGFFNTLFTLPDDDDDEDKKWSDYDRINNIIWGNIKIPLPHGFRQFWGWGVQLALAMKADKAGKEATLDALQHTAGEWIPDQINPFNKFKYNEKSDTWEMDGYGIATTLPTIFRPAIDLAANRDYAGRKIYREPHFNADRIPQTFKGLPHVTQFYQDITNWWFKKGGGDLHYKDINSDKDQKDVSDWYNLNPSSIEYLTKTIFGGTGGFIANMYTTVENAIKGEFDAATTPIIRRFSKPYNDDLTVMREYYKLIDMADDHMYSLKERENAIFKDLYMPAIPAYENRATDPQYLQYLTINAFKDVIKDIERIEFRLQEADKERKKELNNMRINLMKEAKEKSEEVKRILPAN